MTMRQTQTAVLERGVLLESDLATEPFEAGWATEARWFVQVLEGGGSGRMTLRTQISPDGLDWVDAEGAPLEAPDAGTVTLPARDFGHWLRLALTRSGEGEPPLVRVYLALKE